MKETCPLCKVNINEDLVTFSEGASGTRCKLYQRVCKFTDSSKCINRQAKNMVPQLGDSYDEELFYRMSKKHGLV